MRNNLEVTNAKNKSIISKSNEIQEIKNGKPKTEKQETEKLKTEKPKQKNQNIKN